MRAGSRVVCHCVDHSGRRNKQECVESASVAVRWSLTEGGGSLLFDVLFSRLFDGAARADKVP